MLEQVAPLLKDKNGQAYRRRRNQTEDEYLSRLTISCIPACRFLRWLCGYMVLLQSLYQRSAILNCFLCLRSALLLRSVEIASYLSRALLCRQSARILFKRLQGGLSAVSVPKGSFRSKQVGGEESRKFGWCKFAKFAPSKFSALSAAWWCLLKPSSSEKRCMDMPGYCWCSYSWLIWSTGYAVPPTVLDSTLSHIFVMYRIARCKSNDVL